MYAEVEIDSPIGGAEMGGTHAVRIFLSNYLHLCASLLHNRLPHYLILTKPTLHSRSQAYQPS